MSWQSTPLLGVKDIGQPRRQIVETRPPARAARRAADRRSSASAASSRCAMRPASRGATARPCRPGSIPAAAGGCGTRRRAAPATVAVAVPAQLDMVASSPASRARSQARPRCALAWNDEIAIGRRGVRAWRSRAPSAARKLRARRIDIDQRHLGARQPRAQIGDQRADHARADHRDAVGRARRRVPDRVERGLHVGGQHRARRRHVVGQRHDGVGRHVEQGLVRMQREDRAADAARPARPRPGRPWRSRISPGTGKLPPMKGARMRSNSLAGTRPASDQRLGAAAERAVQRAHPHLAGPRAAASRSSRISARPGPTYQSAWATSSSA